MFLATQAREVTELVLHFTLRLVKTTNARGLRRRTARAGVRLAHRAPSRWRPSGSAPPAGPPFVAISERSRKVGRFRIFHHHGEGGSPEALLGLHPFWEQMVGS